jgi:hypothetical protein
VLTHIETGSRFWHQINLSTLSCGWQLSLLISAYRSLTVITVSTFLMRIGLSFEVSTNTQRRSRCPRGLRRKSAAARLLRLRVRIPLEAWTFVCWECCVLSSSGLCEGLITRPEESYGLWCVVVCDLETSGMRRPWSTGGCRVENKETHTEQRRAWDMLPYIDEESDLDVKYFNGLKSYLEHRSHAVRCFQIGGRTYEYQVMVNKAFILSALIVPSSNISLEFVLNVATFFFTHYSIILRYCIEIETDTFLFHLIHCLYAS